jgi:cobalt-precorrin 5A hydrolase
MNGIHVLAFTRAGAALAGKIAAALDGQAWASAQYASGAILPLELPVSAWTHEHFAGSSALIFVSACGIAVRAVAPCLKSKASDPAVLCLDDQGRHVISLLSGHLGGANELALKVASLTGGEAVITTATDVHGAEAVDVWARDHSCAIENISAVKYISAAVLDGRKVGVAVTEQLQPAPWPTTLWLRPKNLVLGAGCKRGTPLESLHGAAQDFLRGAGVSELSLRAVASIDLKADEQGLNALAAGFGVPFLTYSAEKLMQVPGKFSASEKVLAVTGTDNVCERAAVLASGMGPLLRSKTIYPGITLALARVPLDAVQNLPGAEQEVYHKNTAEDSQ